jgi:outer membrane protein assembly factor BamB
LGDFLWRYPHVLQVVFAQAIAPDGTIVVQGRHTPHTPEDGPTVVALDPCGNFLWGGVTRPGSSPAPPATIHQGVVLAPATVSGSPLGGRVYRFDLASGDPLASFELTGPVTDGLAVGGDGTFYVPATPLQAVGDGGAPWSYEMDGTGKTGSNAVVGPSGTIYVAGRGDDHNLHAVNPNGTEKWKRDLGRATIDPIAIDEEERIYVVTAGGLLAVYDLDNELAWSYQVPSGRSGGGMIIGPDHTVYLGSQALPGDYTSEYLFAVREGKGGEGELAWRTLVGLSSIRTTPALSEGGTLYVSDYCRWLVAVRASDGDELWSYKIPELGDQDICPGFSAPVLAPDGTVYAWSKGLADGTGAGLYAFRGDGTGPANSAWPQEGADAAHSGRVSGGTD